MVIQSVEILSRSSFKLSNNSVFTMEYFNGEERDRVNDSTMEDEEKVGLMRSTVTLLALSIRFDVIIVGCQCRC